MCEGVVYGEYGGTGVPRFRLRQKRHMAAIATRVNGISIDMEIPVVGNHDDQVHSDGESMRDIRGAVL